MPYYNYSDGAVNVNAYETHGNFVGGPAAVQMPVVHSGSQPYGAVQPSLDKKAGTFSFIRGQRKRMNIVAILVSLFGPWFLFSVVFAVMSFSIHYERPIFTYFVVSIGLAPVIATFFMAMWDRRMKALRDPRRQPSWHTFSFASCLISWLLAFFLGDINFYQHLKPYYDIQNLSTYPAVDPGRATGAQLMDAGRVVFVESAKIDVSRSIGFKNVERYCVAPIATVENNQSGAPLGNYDFWAVGVNCCSGNKADFHCGDFGNLNAHAGLRLIRDDQRAYFRLAVQQAEAAYNIKATHPLFFHWMQDPMAEINGYKEAGFHYYLLGSLSYLAFQLLFVTTATLLFSIMAQP